MCSLALDYCRATRVTYPPPKWNNTWSQSTLPVSSLLSIFLTHQQLNPNWFIKDKLIVKWLPPYNSPDLDLHHNTKIGVRRCINPRVYCGVDIRCVDVWFLLTQMINQDPVSNVDQSGILSQMLIINQATPASCVAHLAPSCAATSHIVCGYILIWKYW